MMNEKLKTRESFFKQLWSDFAKGTASDKLGIMSSLFTILGVSGVYFYTNFSLGKLLNLELHELGVLFLLTTFLIASSLLIISGMIYASNPKTLGLQLSVIYLAVIVLVWGIGLSLMLLLFSIYMEFIGILF